jgi:hypothetical protein
LALCVGAFLAADQRLGREQRQHQQEHEAAKPRRRLLVIARDLRFGGIVDGRLDGVRQFFADLRRQVDMDFPIGARAHHAGGRFGSCSCSCSRSRCRRSPRLGRFYLRAGCRQARFGGLGPGRIGCDRSRLHCFFRCQCGRFGSGGNLRFRFLVKRLGWLGRLRLGRRRRRLRRFGRSRRLAGFAALAWIEMDAAVVEHDAWLGLALLVAAVVAHDSFFASAGKQFILQDRARDQRQCRKQEKLPPRQLRHPRRNRIESAVKRRQQGGDLLLSGRGQRHVAIGPESQKRSAWNAATLPRPLPGDQNRATACTIRLPGCMADKLIARKKGRSSGSGLCCVN